jgi:surface protein
MNGMFYNCSSLNNLDVTKFDTKNVTDMGCMFYNCSSLNNLDVSKFDTKNVTNMNDIFKNCKFNYDINKFK